MTVQLSPKEVAVAMRDYIVKHMDADLEGRGVRVFFDELSGVTVEIEETKTPKLPGMEE